MRGDLLDVVLLVAAALFAVSGYRQGFVVGVLSFVGFLGGGVVGARLAPQVASSALLRDVPRALVGLGVVFLLATIGQLVATVVGASLRDRLTWRPARLLDAAAGALVSVVSVLLVAWLVGTAVASSSLTQLASQVRRSAVLGAVDTVVPPTARGFFEGFRGLVDDRGFPEVFGGLDPTQVRPVDPPDPALAASPVVRSVREEVLKVTGVARSCSRRIEGTGFVYAPERVMTNAHVVAGVRDPQVEIAGGRSLRGTVVLYDPGRDVAVLRVPGLGLQPLAFAPAAEAGDGAIVVGYPQRRAVPRRRRPHQRHPAGPRARHLRRAPGRAADLRRARPRAARATPAGRCCRRRREVYGVVFAAAADRDDVGYALTAREVASDAAAGRTATERVSTRGCD